MEWKLSNIKEKKTTAIAIVIAALLFVIVFLGKASYIEVAPGLLFVFHFLLSSDTKGDAK